jgi:hypothetical protein
MKIVHSGLLERYAVLFGNAKTISHGRFCDRFWFLCPRRVLTGPQCYKHIQARVTVHPFPVASISLHLIIDMALQRTNFNIL